VTKGAIADPQSFIHPVPHMSFVHGPENVAFLKKRFAAMSAHHLRELDMSGHARTRNPCFVPIPSACLA